MTKALVLYDGGYGHIETLAGPDGKRRPSDNALTIARFQGAHVGRFARGLATTERLAA